MTLVRLPEGPQLGRGSWDRGWLSVLVLTFWSHRVSLGHEELLVDELC